MKGKMILLVIAGLGMGLGLSLGMRQINDAHAIGGFPRTTAFNTEVLCANGAYTALPTITGGSHSYVMFTATTAANEVRICTTEDGDACAVVADGFPLPAGGKYNDDENNPDSWQCLGDGSAVTLFIAGSRGQ